jgi:hypothetical protein
MSRTKKPKNKKLFPVTVCMLPAFRVWLDKEAKLAGLSRGEFIIRELGKGK